MKKELEKHFEFLSKMSVKEYVFYRTWHQINNQKWIGKNLNKIQQIKHNIWKADTPEDYLKIEPKIIIPQKPKEHLEWRILRFFISSAHTLATPGRSIRATVIDKPTGKYLGVMQLVSDFSTLKPRDDYIGWTKQIKEKDKMLNYLAMGATLVPTQPLGYNFLGGKLMALLLCSDVIHNYWNNRYPQPIAALTTTSLFGGFSQYTGLKYWKKLGTTSGEILLEPNDTINLKLRHWMRDNYPEEFEKAGNGSRPKARILNFCYSRIGFRPPKNKAPRGVYFCEMYENAKDFLNKKTADLGKQNFDNSIDALTKLWKEKYASKRINNLLKNDRYNTDSLFYDDIIGMNWEDSKKLYLDDPQYIPKPPQNKFDLFFT